jgi:glutathione S-transferase
VRTRHEPIYHLALVQDWEAAKISTEGYRMSTLGADLADVGFIHCSYAEQVPRIAELLYRGRTDVVLLTINPDALRSRVVVEAADGAMEGEEFPHIYGPIDLDAVVDVAPVALRPDGSLDLPLGRDAS